MKVNQLAQMSNGYLGTLWSMWLAGIINERHIEMSLSLHGYTLTKIDNTQIVTQKENETFAFFCN